MLLWIETVLSFMLFFPFYSLLQTLYLIILFSLENVYSKIYLFEIIFTCWHVCDKLL